ncbi:14474_t:CDS:2 [Entrophospora sp. SA101]|nr:14474_t:CDS:2 [Entrophospora sp. SA101]
MSCFTAKPYDNLPGCSSPAAVRVITTPIFLPSSTHIGTKNKLPIPFPPESDLSIINKVDDKVEADDETSRSRRRFARSLIDKIFLFPEKF